MKNIFLVLLSFVLLGCYPINKTLQPQSTIAVVDEAGKPIENAKVELISNALPYGFEKTRMTIKTDNFGKAYFPKIREWRVELLVMHGFEIYYWHWCVYKDGYETYISPEDGKGDFNSNLSVKLEFGVSSECPEYFR